MRFTRPMLRLFALIGLAVSTALLADQATGAGAFCAFDGGCGAVAASAYGKILGVPLSAIGVGGFAVLFALTLVNGRTAALALRVLAVVAGVVGIGLLAVQIVVLGQMCPLCVVTDVTAILVAGVAVAGRPDPAPLSWPWRAGWLAAAGLAIMVPVFGALALLPEPIPEQVKSHWVPGRVTVVEVTDFECEYCRRADANLRAAMEGHDVHFVRLVAPMPKHEHGRPAGRAYLAAVRQRKGEAMAAALFAAASRAPADCRRLAGELDLDLAGYDRAVKDPATDAELQATIEWAREAGRGLPLIWVQGRGFGGVPTVEDLGAAIAAARPPS